MSDSRDLVYRAFVLYYGNADFTKINSPGEDNAMYAKRVCSLLSEPCYLIAICHQDSEEKHAVKKLSELHWESFQTRLSLSEIDLEESQIPREKNDVFQDMLIIYERNENTYKYKAHTLPLIVEMTSSKTFSLTDYPEKTFLGAALNSFHCLVYFSQ